MFNTEFDSIKENPFEFCPKIQKIQAENISKEQKEQIIKALQCNHAIGINFSLGGYRKCTECNLEQALKIMPHFIKTVD